MTLRPSAGNTPRVENRFAETRAPVITRAPSPFILLNRRVTGSQARYAQKRVGAQFDRVAEAVVHAPQDHIHRLEAVECLEEYAAVAHRQVAPLNQRETEIAGQVRVLEVRLVDRSRRKKHYPRIIAARGRQVQESVAKRAEKGCEPLDLEPPEQVRKGFRQNSA